MGSIPGWRTDDPLAPWRLAPSRLVWPLRDAFAVRCPIVIARTRMSLFPMRLWGVVVMTCGLLVNHFLMFVVLRVPPTDGNQEKRAHAIEWFACLLHLQTHTPEIYPDQALRWNFSLTQLDKCIEIRSKAWQGKPGEGMTCGLHVWPQVWTFLMRG